MSPAERRDRIIQMLTRLKDAKDTGTLGQTGSEGYDSRILRFQPAYNQALRELDNQLTNLKLINPIWHWHTIATHVDIHWRQTPIFTKKATRQGWAYIQSGYTLEPIRHRHANPHLADQGITWLANHYPWDKIHLKAIREACGELQAVAA